ncbi:MAG: M1 family metallopeptidase [Nocardioidaceae bacterium]|nr:M1 family metallopeptidase [Nocardioidaceae bacterium]NUS50032.1 M1 family metallopeptidase [Nocardioidaceae bacterium]
MTLGGRSGADPYVSGHGDTSYDVTHYDLDLDYSIHGNHLEGRARLTLVTREEVDRVELDLHGLKVGKVGLDGGPAKHTTRRNRLVVRLPRTAPAGEEHTVTVRYAGNPKPVRKRHLGTAGWEELTDGVIVAGQPHGAPSWFPCNDRPSNKATYRVAVSASSDYRVVGNGRLVDRRRGSRTTTWVYEQRQPMATYLATLQIGRYDVVRLAERPVPVRAVLPHRLRPRLDDALGRQADMLRYFADLFGDYPFDGYTVVVTEDDLEIPLESQGLSVFGANFLRPDWDAVRLVAHELSHQWFGDSLTACSWQDIWLHEGFACYCEWLWSEESGGPAAHEHANRHWGRLAELDEDLVLDDPGPDLMFDDRVYKRGALFLHVLRLTVGDDAFFSTLRAWVSEHAYGNVTTQMFLAFVAARTGHDVDALAEAWLSRPELPELPARG